MDRNFRNHIITLLIGAGLGLVFFFLVLNIPESPVAHNHSSLTSTVLGLSLANSPDDIYGIIGGPEDEEFMGYIERFKEVLLYQIVLIVLYVVFFLQMIGFSYRNSESQIPVYILSVLVILAALSDIGENFQLQLILDASSSTRMDEPLRIMSYFTMVKWSLIFITSAMLSMKTWLSEKGLLLKGMSISLFTSFLFYLCSYIRLNLIELGILFLIIGFFLFWSYSLLIIVLSKKT